MLSISVRGFVDCDIVFKQFLEKLEKAWKQNTQRLTNEIRLCIKNVLLKNLQSMDFGEQVTTEYPFLLNLQSLADRYSKCVVVDASDLKINIVVDPNELKKNGLPEDLYELFEFGYTDFPRVAHIEESMRLWRSRYEKEFFKDIAAYGTL